MKTTLIASLITALIKMLPSDTIKKGIDSLLDRVEDAVAKSPNKLDDSILTLCGVIRQQLNIPDNG